MCREDLARRAVAIAVAEEGEREVGSSNWGPRVKEYLKAANVTVPAAWCAGFVNWSFEQAALELGVTSPLESVPLQAYVQSYVQHGKANNWVVPNADARAGDLFCLWNASLKRYAHIGIVTGWTMDGKRLTTIEGNTNDEGSREGYEVAKRTRTPVEQTIVILRPV